MDFGCVVLTTGKQRDITVLDMEVWIVDGLIGFLQSPGWTSPINNFIDKNCVGKVYRSAIIIPSIKKRRVSNYRYLYTKTLHKVT